MKTFTMLVSLFIFSFVQLCYAQTTVPTYNPMSDVFAISVAGGVTFGGTDYSTTKIGALGTASLEYFFSTRGNGIFGIKGYGGMGQVGGQSDTYTPKEFKSTVDYLGLGLTYVYSIKESIYPFISIGYSNFWIWPRDKDKFILPKHDNGVLVLPGFGDDAVQAGGFTGDIGVKFMASRFVSINISAGVLLTSSDYIDGMKTGPHNDAASTITAGLSYYFGRNKDSDGDGVPDYMDACPNTPIGVKVDAMGCPLDSDGDGVPDYLDKCPNTPKGVQVDKFGCPLDSDGDGVPDYLDKCPNTPTGVQVDKNGCPLDADGDGVPDYLDKCPNTPEGVQVDKNGCPLDSDGDGVPDYLDKCPNTPKGVQVDKYGCPIIKEEVHHIDVEHMILRGDANFEFNKSKLLPAGIASLDELIPTMKNHAGMKWTVEGYTDAIGSDKYNLKLSGRRAQAVIDYLVSKGISKSALVMKAFGKANPVATNETEEGRAENRRVEIRVIK